MEIINDVLIENNSEPDNVSFGGLNLKRQYKNAVVAAHNWDNLKIVEEKIRYDNMKDSIYLYLEFDPGVFK